MEEKRFDLWVKKKEILNGKKIPDNFHVYEREIWWSAPLSTKIDFLEQSRLHYIFECDGITRAACFDDFRTISIKRLLRYINIISPEDFDIIRRYMKDLM